MAVLFTQLFDYNCMFYIFCIVPFAINCAKRVNCTNLNYVLVLLCCTIAVLYFDSCASLNCTYVVRHCV